MRNPREILRFLIIAIALLAGGGYAYFQAYDLIVGPIIAVASPRSGASMAQALVEIQGSARNVAYLSLNDRQIFVDDKGEFREQLLLSYGYNKIVVEGRDRFGRQREEALELIYQ